MAGLNVRPPRRMRLFVIILMLTMVCGCRRDKRGDAAIVNDLHSPVFEMRLVEDSISSDSEQMTLSLKGKDGSPTQEIINVRKTPKLVTADVEETRIWVREDIVGINLTLTDTARKKLDELTHQNIGRRVAILIDGQLRAAPEINGEMTLGEFDVISDWTPDEARLLAKKIELASKSLKK